MGVVNIVLGTISIIYKYFISISLCVIILAV